MIFLKLFFEFLKTGLFAIGGGLATLPFLKNIAIKTNWFTEAMLADMIAISESTPGPIGVNMATYAGYLTAGIPGALVGTLGLITPPIIIMLFIARILEKFQDNLYVKSAFYGLRPAVAGLIGAAGISVAKASLVHLPFNGLWLDFLDIPSICIFISVFVLLKVFKKHPILYLALSAVVGIILGFV